MGTESSKLGYKSMITPPPKHQSLWAFRNTAMYLVDSDFETDDDSNGEDNIDEVISNQIVNSAASDGPTLDLPGSQIVHLEDIMSDDEIIKPCEDDIPFVKPLQRLGLSHNKPKDL